ncbi:MAG: PAS domain S-box protein [Fidelibacterota bacterium]|nr:MAG: PAS domain S-box protein [Candidatus Neomarinimicrobiota bacterium]
MKESFRIYPIIPSCTFTVGINLFKHYLDRSIIENDVTLLAYGTCHPQILELLAEYGNRVIKVKGNNCYEMFLGTEKYAEYHKKRYWMLNEPFFTKWKKDILVGYGAGTVNGSMLIEDAYEKLVYLRFEKDQLDINLVEDFADNVGLEYEVHMIDTGNLKRLLEEALASASLTQRRKLPESSLKYPSRPDVQTILDNIGEIIYRIDVHTKEFTFISPQVETLLGYTQAEFIDILNNHVIVPLYHEDEREKVMIGRYNFLIKCLNERMQEAYQMEYRVKHKNGNLVWVMESVYPTYGSMGVIESFVGKIVDITERKRVEEALQKAHNDLEKQVKKRTAELEALTEELKNEILERQQVERDLNRLNRAYLMVCECNQELIRNADEQALLNNICRIITGMGGYRLAWVGFTEHDENKTVLPVASAGYEEGYLESLDITWADEPTGRGPTGTAIRTGRPAIAKNILTNPQFAPWRRRAIKRGYASSIALPLHIDQENIGALNIYAQDPEAFDEEEVNLLIKLADNLAYGIISLRIRDERNRAEEALRESEELYRTLVETAPEGVSMTDLEGRLVYVSQRIVELHGYERADELLGRNALDLIAPEDREKAIKNIQKTLEEGSLREQEVILLRKDGTHFIGGVNATALKGADGQARAFITTSRDITERKRTGQALRESERSLAEAQRIGRIGNWDLNLVKNELKWSDEIYRIFGLEPQEFGATYEAFLDAVHPDDREYVDTMYAKSVKNSTPYDIVHRIIRKSDGEVRYVHEKCEHFKDQTGKMLRSIGTVQDITELKRAENELKATQEQLRNLSTHLQSLREEDRASLAREIHDELGQALTVLKFGLMELKNALPADKISLVEKVTSMAEYIDATAQTVNEIATQLRPTLLDELGLVEAIEWEVEEFENRTGIKCELMVKPEEMVVDRDRSTAIYRIVQEALTNIARHAQTTRSAVSLKMSDGKLHLSITDNGIGITEEKVLNPKALGIIGMRERVLSVGGNFKINGIKDRGTKIRVIIPVKVEDKADAKNSDRG